MGNGLSFLWMLLQTIFALVVVCGLAYLIFRVILPRLAVGGFGNANNMVRIVDRIQLDARKSLYVIEVAGKWMLIASSESGVQFISELDSETAKISEQELGRITQTSQLKVSGKKFNDKLNEIMKRKSGGE